MKKSVAIIGSGPASLLLAAHLDAALFEVTIYEKNKSSGRKFLVAGDGGFNLTHAEPMNSFVWRYTPSSFMKDALTQFNNEHLIQWLDSIGIPTFTGSSKRVFPEEGIKPIEVLNKILLVHENKNVSIKFEHEWTGWNGDGNLTFNSSIPIEADYVVFALGGGSWKVTGSDGMWLNKFSEKGIHVIPFRASNCEFNIDWSDDFIKTNEGKPLKNISITCEGKSKKGEVIITKNGMEGNAIYALSPQIQKQLSVKNEAYIFIDLKPDLTLTEIGHRLKNSFGIRNTSEILNTILNLTKPQIALLKSLVSKNDFLNYETLSQKIKNLPVTIIGSALIDEAISTTGGIDLNEVNSHFELKKLKNNYCIGEMLDWDAPTGGYLLQGCFSMGVHLAKHLNSVNLNSK